MGRERRMVRGKRAGKEEKDDEREEEWWEEREGW